MTLGENEQPILTRLDDRLRADASGWPRETRQRLAEFILARQTAAGGFTGKAGAADLYYTGWALRGLWLIDCIEEPTRTATRQYLAAAGPGDLIELTSWLMAQLAIEDTHSPTSPRTQPLGPATLADGQRAAFGKTLHSSLVGDGGFARAAGAPAGSTYLTFLGLLAGQMLGETPPETQRVLEFLRSRRRDDGGFAEGPYGRVGSANPTAAAVGVLLLAGAAAPADWLFAASDFLQRGQHADGGWRAWPHSAGGDLLSTFTALYMLEALGRLARIDRRAAEDFTRACLRADGGFAGTTGEAHGDVEFTCYGISALALLGVRP